MKYECCNCLEIIDEEDLFIDTEIYVILCPFCFYDDLKKLDDNDYGN